MKYMDKKKNPICHAKKDFHWSKQETSPAFIQQLV